MKYFTVGPSQLHPRFREFLDEALAKDIPSLSHRSATFTDLFARLRNDLNTLMRTQGHQAFYTGSATEWMERTIQNMSAQRTLHFFGGIFGWRYWRIAQELSRDAISVASRPDGSFSVEDIPADVNPELICLTHNETSNGTVVSEDFLVALRARFPHALIAVDVVSSAPLFSDAFSQADCLFFSVQKVFGLPAGLGVGLVNDRALEKAKEVARTRYTGSFHSFEKFVDNAARNYTPETPNVLGMYLLQRVCDDFLSRGVEVLREDMNAKANVLYEALAQAGDVELPDLAEAYRSHTVLVARAPGGSQPIIERLKKEGFIVNSGYKDQKDTHIRIANFPAHTIEDVQKLAGLLRGRA